jgi:hypothetical protein
MSFLHIGGRDRQRLVQVVAAAFAAVVLLTACSADGKAFESIRGGAENAERVRSYESWGDLIALAKSGGRSDGGGRIADPIDAAVLGDVIDVEEGRSFKWDVGPEGSELRLETEFGSSDAMISTYHLTVKVSTVIGPTDAKDAAGSSMLIGLAVDSDVTLKDVESDFSSITGAVFFVSKSPVFDYDSRLFAIVEDGALMAVPADDGSLTFPLLAASDSVQPPGKTRASDLKGRD